MGEQTESDDFLAFSSNKNSGDSQNQRNNFQYRPYNRNRNQNQRNHNFRREQWGGQRNDSDGQFAPADYSSPVGGYQHRFDRGFRGRPNMNQFQNQRHFTPFKKFGGQRGGGGGGHNFKDAPIQQYFHQSMLEDPWAQCHKFNGTATPDPIAEPAESVSTESEPFEVATES